MSMSMYRSAKRSTPMTETERKLIDELLRKYSVEKEIAQHRGRVGNRNRPGHGGWFPGCIPFGAGSGSFYLSSRSAFTRMSTPAGRFKLRSSSMVLEVGSVM